jgi:serine/threonine-protein kinase HipA
MNRCYICGKELEESRDNYHKRCLKTLFNSTTIPIIDYTWSELNKLASQIISQKISVPGVQPKLSVHLKKDHKNKPDSITIVGLEGDYILKPPTETYPFLPKAEHFCMLFARLIGIQTADFGLILLKSGELAFITSRMDRTPDGMLHMEDFCQLTDKLTEQKYRGSMEQIGKTLRQFSSTPGLNAIRFFEIALFSFLTGNSDMHLKNFSMLRDNKGNYNLAPAYDLVPVKIILPTDNEEMALPLNGRKNKLTRNDFESFANTIKLTPKQIDNTFKRILTNCKNKVQMAISQSFLSQNTKKEFNNLFQERLNRLQ